MIRIIDILLEDISHGEGYHRAFKEDKATLFKMWEMAFVGK